MLNEEHTAEELYKRLARALEGRDWELVAVDDGSDDTTPAILRRLADADDRVRMVRLSRRFGHQAALTAGLDHARGDVVITIDADLQDPPEVIPKLIDEWRCGRDVVHAVRDVRPGEPRWRLAAITTFYRLFGRIAGTDVVANSGDFRLLDRRAVDALGSMRERNRFLRGMSVWVGFSQARVTYERDSRFAGETKYPFGRLLELALDAIISFSRVPLRVAAVLGAVVSLVALVAVPVVIVLKIAGSYVPGIASLTVVVLLLGGVQLLTLGIIGEYLGRSYEESKRRPIYVVGERRNIAAPTSGPGAGESFLERVPVG
jgi:dolichol-phosphate mannosyltransferase